MRRFDKNRLVAIDGGPTNATNESNWPQNASTSVTDGTWAALWPPPRPATPTGPTVVLFPALRVIISLSRCGQLTSRRPCGRTGNTSSRFMHSTAAASPGKTNATT